jgi:hypothetical protein
LVHQWSSAGAFVETTLKLRIPRKSGNNYHMLTLPFMEHMCIRYANLTDGSVVFECLGKELNNVQGSDILFLIINVFSPPNAQLDSLKNNFKFALKLTLKSS